MKNHTNVQRNYSLELANRHGRCLPYTTFVAGNHHDGLFLAEATFITPEELMAVLDAALAISQGDDSNICGEKQREKEPK
jgi:hypothetical protein